MSSLARNGFYGEFQAECALDAKRYRSNIDNELSNFFFFFINFLAGLNPEYDQGRA